MGTVDVQKATADFQQIASDIESARDDAQNLAHQSSGDVILEDGTNTGEPSALVLRDDAVQARDQIKTSIAATGGVDYVVFSVSERDNLSASDGEVALVLDGATGTFYEYDAGASSWTERGPEIGEKIYFAVDSVSALQSLEPDPTYIVFVRGYASASDDGGGFFWWDASGNAANANGGTAIASTVSGYTDGDASEGLWRRHLQQRSVRHTSHFGHGPSSVSDEDAVRAAANDLPDKGTLRIDRDAVIGTEIEISGISAIIDFRGATLTLEGGMTEQRMIKVSGGDFAHFFGGRIDGNRENQNYESKIDGVQYGTPADYTPPNNNGLLTAENVEVASCRDVDATGVIATLFFANNCTTATVNNIRTQDGDAPVNNFPGVIAGRNTTRLQVKDARISRCNIGVVYTDPDAADGSVLSCRDCHIEESAQGALWNETAQTFRVDGFSITEPDTNSFNGKVHCGNGSEYVSIRNGDMNLVNNQGFIDLNISSSLISGVIDNVDLQTPGGTDAITAPGARVENCRVDTPATYGIRADTVARCTVNSADRGIRLANLVDGCTLNNCFRGVRNCSEIKSTTINSPQVGIEFSNGGKVSIRDVEISSCSEQAIRVFSNAMDFIRVDGVTVIGWGYNTSSNGVLIQDTSFAVIRDSWIESDASTQGGEGVAAVSSTCHLIDSKVQDGKSGINQDIRTIT